MCTNLVLDVYKSGVFGIIENIVEVGEVRLENNVEHKRTFDLSTRESAGESARLSWHHARDRRQHIVLFLEHYYV